MNKKVFLKDFVLTPSSRRCPTCQSPMEVATCTAIEMAPREPNPGDVIICWECGALNAIDAHGQVSSRSDADLEQYSPEARAIIEKLRAKIKGGGFTK